MKKKIIIGIICFLVLLVCGLGGYFFMNNNSFGTSSWKSDGNLHILTSIDDKVVGDSMWCGTFQLVWNNMINEIVKQDAVFTPQLEIVENLNKQTFTNKELSPNSYYSKLGLLTLNLKEEIENGVKEKFNETSDLLDQLDWSDVPQSDDYYEGRPEKIYGIYAMLKKIFKFESIFDQLDNGKFADKYDNIKYFGIEGDSDSSLYDQVYIYYYNSDKDFAVALKTIEGEDVILARGIKGNSFMDIYNEILRKGKKYEGNNRFTSHDYLKVPELDIKDKSSFADLKYKKFYAKDGSICKINEAMQTIELKLDKEGGEVKSEAWIEVSVTNGLMSGEPSKIKYRYFYFDKPYVMFLKEADKDLPYFAAQISDITLFQK